MVAHVFVDLHPFSVIYLGAFFSHHLSIFFYKLLKLSLGPLSSHFLKISSLRAPSPATGLVAPPQSPWATWISCRSSLLLLVTGASGLNTFLGFFQSLCHHSLTCHHLLFCLSSLLLWNAPTVVSFPPSEKCPYRNIPRCILTVIRLPWLPQWGSR